MSLQGRVSIRVAIAVVFVALVLVGCFPGLGGQQQMTWHTNAVYSPDGERIAFISNADGDFEIYVMNYDGSNVKKITDNTYNETIVEWSPDGKQFLFSSDRDEQVDIYVMNTDGSNVRKIEIQQQ